MQCGRLPAFSQIERMEDITWVKMCRLMDVEGSRGRSRHGSRVISADLDSIGVNDEIAQHKSVLKCNDDEQLNPC